MGPSSRLPAKRQREEKETVLAGLREEKLLRRSVENEILDVGTLVWAKDTGSIYWPACIVPNPPDEDESVEDKDESSMFAFLMYIEPKFRLGLVSWSSLIPVNIAEAELQFGFISELNKLEAKKPLKARKSLGEAFDLMREFFPVEPSQRQERMQKKFEEFVQERRKRLGGNLKKRRNKTTCPIAHFSPPKEELPPPPRRSTKFSLRPNVTVPKKWDSSAMSSESTDNVETSSTSTTSSKKATKTSRPVLDGEALKLWAAEKFGRMDKQLKYESKIPLTCSKCGFELQVEDSADCHGYPFHKECLVEIDPSEKGILAISTHEDGEAESSSRNQRRTYACEDCVEKRCFICKKLSGHPNEAKPEKCSKCSLRFHRDCLVFKWPQADVVGSNGLIVCPLHFCHVCKAEHYHFDKVRNYRVSLSKAIRCIYCLSTYHRGTCIPAGCGNSIMNDRFLICPRHVAKESVGAKKKKLGCFGCRKKLGSKDSVVSCTLCPLAFHECCVYGEYYLKVGISLDAFRTTFKCEGCLWGTFPLYGQVVWYQQPGSIYWPSLILYPKDAASRGAKGVGQFSVSYCGFPVQYYDNARSSFTVSLEIGNKDFLKKLNLYSNQKVATAAKEAFHLIKLSECNRDKTLPPPEPIYNRIEKNLYRVPVSSVTLRKKGNGKQRNPDKDEMCLCGKSSGTEPVCTLDSGCFNRDAAIECNNTNCAGKDRCQNRMFSTRRKADKNKDLLEYFVSPSTKGWGLRTKTKFEEGTFLCEYTGEIISKEEVMWRVERKSDDEPLYFLEINTTTFIDAEYYGNMSRLINHSCDPNCRIEKYYSAHGKPVVGIFAKRDIPEGEELTFDYNYGPKSTFAFQCRCKSENCKGFIGRPRGNEENLMPNGKKIVRKSKVEESDWKWEDECATCGTRGELLMCDYVGCSKAYHLQCLGIVSTPKGDWNCPSHELEKKESTKPPPQKKSRLSARV